MTGRSLTEDTSLDNLLAARRLHQHATALWDAQDQPITLAQLALLVACERHGTQNQATLVDLAGMDRSTVADVVRRMAEQGLVSVEPDPADKRSRLVTITAAGRQTLRSSIKDARAASQRLGEVFPGLRLGARAILEASLINTTAKILESPTAREGRRGDSRARP